MLADFFLVCWIAVLAVAAVVFSILIATLVVSRQEERERERQDREAAEREARAAAERRREQQRQAENQLELERHKEQLEREHREREERAESERQQALALAVADLKPSAEERFKGAVTAGSAEELDGRLREAQLVFSRCGRVLTARVFAVPTGWVAIEWMLDPGLPLPLRVVCTRDKKVVFAVVAYQGLFADVLARGREYTFTLEAYEGESPRERGLTFVVKVPTEQQWRRKVAAAAPPDALAEQRRRIETAVKVMTAGDEQWEQARREEHGKIDGAEGADADKRRRKARLDARIEQARDKEEQQAQ